MATGSPHQHPSHPDYVPSVFSFNRGNESGKLRYHRRMERMSRQEEQRLEKIRRQEQMEKEREIQEKERKKEEERIQKEKAHIQKEKEEKDQREAVQQQLEAAHSLLHFSQQEFNRDAMIQTDDNLVSQIQLLKAQNSKLKSSVFSVKVIEGNDSATQFYTGLPNY